MPLDPDMKMVLDVVNSMEPNPSKETDVEKLRLMMDTNPVLRPMEDIHSSIDGKIEIAGYMNDYRLYDPGDSGNELIIYFHGGGFVFGSIDSVESICRRIANSSGCKVMSVAYRLAPESKFPTAVDDAFSSYEWVVEHSEDLGIDKSRIAVCGDSAGGNLSAVTCFRCRSSGVKMPRIQGLLYPFVGHDVTSTSQREYGTGYFLTEEQSRWFGEQYLRSWEDLLNPEFSPLMNSSFSGLPEAVVITAEYDPLRDQGETYLARLRAAGVPATGLRVNGLIHGFASFLNVVPAAKSILTMFGYILGSKLRD